MSTTMNTQAYEEQDDDMHFSDFVVLMSENWKLILSVLAVVLGLGTGYALLAQPVYEANAMIQVEDSANPAQDALGDLASMFDSKQTAAAEMEIMQSRLVVSQTVSALHLDITASPRYFPIIGQLVARYSDEDGVSSAPLGLTSFAWGGEKIEVSSFDVPKKYYGKKYTLVAEKNNRFVLRNPDDVIVAQGDVGSLVSGADMATSIKLNSLVARPGSVFFVQRESTLETIDKLQKKLVIVEKTKQSGVISLSLDGPDAGTTASTINKIASAYVQQNIDRKSSEAQHTLEFLDTQLPALRKELDQAEDRYNAYRNKKGTVDLTEESRLLLQQIVDGRTKLADLQAQRFEMAQRFAETHPAVVALDAQIENLQNQQEQLNHRVLMTPDTEQMALRLLRDVRVDTELYTNLLNNAQQLKIVKAGQVGNVRVVDFAVADDVPVQPKRALVIAISAAFGLALGVGLVFVKKALFGGIEDSEGIERAAGLSVLAVIPHSSHQAQLQGPMRNRSGQRVLAVSMSDDVAIEGMRSLRTALEFSLVDARNNVIVVTGPRPGIGKSFTAVNLSAVLAGGGKRVLLIDADMRRGDAHSYFNVTRQPGLSDALNGHAVEDLIVRDVVPGLDFMPKGSFIRNPAELLHSIELNSILERVSKLYDVVLIDTPPVLPVTDATVISKLAGATLLVARHGHHTEAEIKETAKRLRAGGAALKGILFTDAPLRRIGSTAHYGSYYGYTSVEK
ncbi:polysaccharide biosynthesis tyrosine autokinase [Paraburkholderia aspalathi]|uniref:polysaccharide biosynthesis tyrosine autokinase n=1 Tax=Paraburkholderia aspalathi TaxID=1324617 RepID=UPI0038BA64C8